MRPAITAIVLAATALVVHGCTGVESAGCLGSSSASCRPPVACARLTYQCSASPAHAFLVSDPSQRPSGLSAQASVGDFTLQNDQLVAVIDALDHPHHLAPTGGTLIDLAPRGGDDHLNQVYQVTGILPRDAAHYETSEMFEADGAATVIVRGHLDGEPHVRIVTRYELQPCDPGVRIRTEVYNDSATIWSTYLADGYWWGDRGVTPFVPLTGQGFLQPSLDLLHPDTAWREFPWMAAQSHGDADASYVTMPCVRERLAGLNSSALSAAGTPRTLLRTGDGLAFERMIFAAAGSGIAGAVGAALDARSRLFGEPSAHATGRTVDAAGMPIGGDERLVSLVFYEPATGPDPDADTGVVPWAETVPAADGTFDVALPSGHAFRMRAWQLGRPLGAGIDVPASLALGDTVVGAPAMLSVTTQDATGAPLDTELVLVPTAATTSFSVAGSENGYFAGCAPYLGPPHGGSPACNRVLARGGLARFAVPDGTYWLYAQAGPDHSLARQSVTMVRGAADVHATLVLTALTGLYPAGSLTADFHVHGGRSFDITLPDRDRVTSFVTAGVRVIAATDHDTANDYHAAVAALGVADRVLILPGVETTGEIPYFHVPGSALPHDIGHYNFWPVTYDERLARNGVPWDELIEPAQLFDAMSAVMPERGVIQLNHPTATALVGRDLGYLRAIGFNPGIALPDHDDGTGAAMLIHQPSGSTRRNLDWDAQEAMQGADLLFNLQYRAVWHALLSQGILRAGTANSDSHSLHAEQLGYPRNVVLGSYSLAGFDRIAFDQAVREGRLVGGNGPFIDAHVRGADAQDHGPSLLPFAPAEGAVLDVTVTAPPWIPVTEVRFVVNGRVVRTIEASQLSTPADAFGTDGVTRWHGSVALSDLVGSADAWISVEAGLPLPPAVDTTGDGLFDALDGNGDGTPAETTVDPPTESDPRFHVNVISPGTWPMAFTNPFVLDVDADGRFTAPGLPR